MTDYEAEQVWAYLHTEGSNLAVFLKGRDWVGGARLDHPSKLLSLANRLANDTNAFVCLNPSRGEGVKPCQGDIIEARWMLLDMDRNSYGSDKRDIRQVLAVVQAALIKANNGFNPLIVPTFTGRGIHLWVRMGEGPPCIPKANQLFKVLTNHIQQTTLPDVAKAGYFIDLSCADVSRIARLPGTINRKNNERSYFLFSSLAVEPGKAGMSWAAIRSLPGAGAESPPAPSPTPVQGGGMFHIAPKLNPTARHFLLFGTDTGEDSRHNDCVAAAKGLKDAGVPAEVAEGLLHDGAARCTPRLAEHEWRRIYRKVFDVGEHYPT